MDAKEVAKVQENQQVEVLTPAAKAAIAGVTIGGGGVSVEETRVFGTITTQGVQRRAGRDVQTALAAAGITPSRLASDLAAGLRARKLAVVGGRMRRLPDWNARHRFLVLAHQLRGDLQQTTEPEGSMTYEQRLLRALSKARANTEKPNDTE